MSVTGPFQSVLSNSAEKEQGRLTKVLDVKHLGTALDLEPFRRPSAAVGAEAGTAFAVVRDGHSQDGRQMGPVELDKLDSDRSLLPELENAVDRCRQDKVGSGYGAGKEDQLPCLLLRAPAGA